MTDHQNTDPQLPLFNLAIGEFVPISHLVHGRTKMLGLRRLQNIRAIRMAATRGREPVKVEPPIGADDPVERYPDGEFSD